MIEKMADGKKIKKKYFELILVRDIRTYTLKAYRKFRTNRSSRSRDMNFVRLFTANIPLRVARIFT